MSEPLHNIPARLAEVRSLAKLSQAELAKKLGVSTSLISHWEKGTRTPSQPQLLELSRHLGVALDYLLNAEIRPDFSFRSRSRSGFKAIENAALDRVLIDASMQIHFLDTALRLAGKPPTPFSLLAQFTAFSDLPNIAAHLRDTLRLNRRVTLGEFKQALSEWNIFVFEWAMPWQISGLSFRGPFTAIIINHQHTPARRLFTLAHEFAHVVFHLGRQTPETKEARDTVVSIASQRDPLEKQANAFAGEFLIPTPDLKNLVSSLGDRLRDIAVLDAAARYFNVSRDAIFYRLAQRGFFDWPEKSSYFTGAFEHRETPPHRINKVDDIQDQVDPTFLQTVLSLHQEGKVSTGKLAEWLFAPRHIVEGYLARLTRLEEQAISDEPNHEEETEAFA